MDEVNIPIEWIIRSNGVGMSDPLFWQAYAEPWRRKTWDRHRSCNYVPTATFSTSRNPKRIAHPWVWIQKQPTGAVNVCQAEDWTLQLCRREKESVSCVCRLCCWSQKTDTKSYFSRSWRKNFLIFKCLVLLVTVHLLPSPRDVITDLLPCGW